MGHRARNRARNGQQAPTERPGTLETGPDETLPDNLPALGPLSNRCNYIVGIGTPLAICGRGTLQEKCYPHELAARREHKKKVEKVTELLRAGRVR